MVRAFSRAILATIVLASASSASLSAPVETQSFESSTTILAESCGKDIEANCLGVSLDATRLKECLSRNQDVASPQCRQNFLVPFDQIQKRINARAMVAQSCRLEIIKLCHGSTKETSKSVPCLMTAKGVSRNCTQATVDAGYR